MQRLEDLINLLLKNSLCCEISVVRKKEMQRVLNPREFFIDLGLTEQWTLGCPESGLLEQKPVVVQVRTDG